MKPLSIKSCTTNLKSLAEKQVLLTLSLAYHATVHGNVSPFKDLDNTVVNRLDAVYRQFISVKWDKTVNEGKGGWVFSVAKSKKLCKQFDLEYKKGEFEAFVAGCKAALDAKEVKRLEAEQAEAALDPVAQKNKEINDMKDTVEKYLSKKAETLTEAQMLDIVRKIYNGKQATAA